MASWKCIAEPLAKCLGADAKLAREIRGAWCERDLTDELIKHSQTLGQFFRHRFQFRMRLHEGMLGHILIEERRSEMSAIERFVCGIWIVKR